MKNAAKILMLIGAIISIFAAVTFLILGLVFVLMGIDSEAKNSIIQGLSDGTITTTFEGTYEEQATAIQLVYAVLGFAFVIWTVVLLIGSVITFVARSKYNKPLLIITIILGVVGMVYINSVGAVFGLIDNSRNSD